MKRNISRIFKGHFGKVVLVIAAALLIAVVYNIQDRGGAGQASLQDVLRGAAASTETKSGSSAGAFGVFLASLVAVSFATVSLAKGHEIFKRSVTKLEDPVDEEVQNCVLELSDIRRENNRILLDNEKLVGEAEYLKKEKSLLGSKLFNYKETIETLMTVESELKRSNITLQRDVGRLRVDNEKLSMSVHLEVKKAVPAVKKKKVVKASAKKARKSVKKKRKTG